MAKKFWSAKMPKNRIRKKTRTVLFPPLRALRSRRLLAYRRAAAGRAAAAVVLACPDFSTVLEGKPEAAAAVMAEALAAAKEAWTDADIAAMVARQVQGILAPEAPPPRPGRPLGAAGMLKLPVYIDLTSPGSSPAGSTAPGAGLGAQPAGQPDAGQALGAGSTAPGAGGPPPLPPPPPPPLPMGPTDLDPYWGPGWTLGGLSQLSDPNLYPEINSPWERHYGPRPQPDSPASV